MIEVVANEPRFFEFIRALRNDERVKSGFIEQTSITAQQQTDYMSLHGNEYVVALVDGMPAGYAASVNGDIRVCTHPDFQRKGVGGALVRAIMERYPDSRAKVKVGNLASINLFKSCGFHETYLLLESDES